MRSSRSRRHYQDPRYVQLWFAFDWPKPADRVPVCCATCDWTGRRTRRAATRLLCPRCTGQVMIGRRRGQQSRQQTDSVVVPLNRGDSAGRPQKADRAPLRR